jgi:hypothetical protein
MISCNKGAVTRQLLKPSELEQKIGEWADVWCVANGKKPLAALDYSNYGRRKIKNFVEIRKVIAYANMNGVQALHIPNENSAYLKTIFFKKSQFENAKRLMYILWFGIPIASEVFHGYAIGKLLGYSLDNIKYFIERSGHQITPKEIKHFNMVLKFKVNNSDIPGVVRYATIPDPEISVAKRILM